MVFKFKQFNVDQTNCAMKINTDGVLLGALADGVEPKSILDIGTGTGVIALMLAQKFINAQIDAVEIDPAAAETAGRNFANSPFASQLTIHSTSFQEHFSQHPDKKYELIISNPPFYIQSLKSPKGKVNLAKHADDNFFEALVKTGANNLSIDGKLWLILPIDTAQLVTKIAGDNNLYAQHIINIHSFEYSEAHRAIICLGFADISTEISTLYIYKTTGIYSDDYMKLLKPYFLAF